MSIPGLRYFAPRFIAAFCRNIALKIRYGSALRIDIFRTYISSGSVVAISGTGRMIFRAGGRVFVSPGCELIASSGVLDVGAGVFFNRNCSIVAHDVVSIGEDCMFGPGVCIYDADHVADRIDKPFRLQGYKKARVSIGQNVWIGANTVVTRGSSIGDHVVVGAGSIVRGELMSASVYAGNPLRHVRSIPATS